MVTPHTAGQNDYQQDIGFTLRPDLSVTNRHQGGPNFSEGQSITYTLMVRSSAGNGPVSMGSPIIVRDTLPTGLNNVIIHAPGWHIWPSQLSSPLSITATYIGAYPVAPDSTLPPITISGTLTKAAIPHLVNHVRVSTPNDTNATNDTASDSITVKLQTVLRKPPALPPTGSDPKENLRPLRLQEEEVSA